MYRPLFAGAALLLAAGAVVSAQQPPAASESPWSQQRLEDRAAFLDSRIAALRAGLRLTPEQEKAWPAFERAWRDLAALRGQHRPGRTGGLSDPVARMRSRADAMAARGAALRRYADAMEPLYQSLDDGQRRRFGFLSRIAGERRFAVLRGERWHGGLGRDGGPPFGPGRGEFRPRGEEHEDFSAPL